MFVRNYHQGDKWLPGIVQKKTAPVSYRVRLATGKERRHRDQVRNRSVIAPQDSNPEPELPDVEEIAVPTTNTEPSTSPGTTNTTPGAHASPDLGTTITDAAVVNPTTTERSYPRRNCAPVVRFEPTWT